MAQRINSKTLATTLREHPRRCEYNHLSPFSKITEELTKKLHLRDPDCRDYRHNMDASDQSAPEKAPLCGVDIWLPGYQRPLDGIVALSIRYTLPSTQYQGDEISVEVFSKYFRPSQLEVELVSIITEFNKTANVVG